MFKMFRRFFWLAVGFVLGPGVLLGVQPAGAQASRERYVPAEVADRWSGTMRAAVTEGREADARRAKPS